jgi:hypothetical protein
MGIHGIIYWVLGAVVGVIHLGFCGFLLGWRLWFYWYYSFFRLVGGVLVLCWVRRGSLVLRGFIFSILYWSGLLSL